MSSPRPTIAPVTQSQSICATRPAIAAAMQSPTTTTRKTYRYRRAQSTHDTAFFIPAASHVRTLRAITCEVIDVADVGLDDVQHDRRNKHCNAVHRSLEHH